MPLVSRSGLHGQEHDNDLVNHRRLASLVQPGGTLVFDGGYVFDSVSRTIMESGLSGVWVRRGLWQKGQDNSIALDREKVFQRVIVPSEAFDELNASYSSGAHVQSVGPIVQRLALAHTDREAIRDELARKYGSFRHLVVSMLGGGVAADRSAQLAALAGIFASRSEDLHLIVVWPTATVPANLYNWPNTKVVKTHHALPLTMSSDLFISAVGYNSFHEAMYNRIPTIFLAQVAAYMDDQAARASAAVLRGAARQVDPGDLHSLGSLITAMLDGALGQEVRAALDALELPDPGNAHAARLIAEVSH